MLSGTDSAVNVTRGGKRGAQRPWDADQDCVGLLGSCRVGGKIPEGKWTSRLTSKEGTQSPRVKLPDFPGDSPRGQGQ